MAKRRKSGEGLIRQRKGGRIDRTDIYGEGLSDRTVRAGSGYRRF